MRGLRGGGLRRRVGLEAARAAGLGWEDVTGRRGGLGEAKSDAARCVRRGELLAALHILDSGDISPEQMRGSWAGAMGQTQFMPTIFLKHAVDYDHDGRRDIWNSLPDVFASTAHFVALGNGWRRGDSWGEETGGRGG